MRKENRQESRAHALIKKNCICTRRTDIQLEAAMHEEVGNLLSPSSAALKIESSRCHLGAFPLAKIRAARFVARQRPIKIEIALNCSCSAWKCMVAAHVWPIEFRLVRFIYIRGVRNARVANRDFRRGGGQLIRPIDRGTFFLNIRTHVAISIFESFRLLFAFFSNT